MERSNADLTSHLAARARRAYELGRLRAKLPAALFALPPAAVALEVCGRPWVTLPVATLLAAALVAAHWRGEAAARGAGAGLVAGALAFAAPVLASGLGLCPARPSAALLTVCWGGGLVSGGVLALCARRAAGQRRLYLVAAGVVAGLTGSLGCILAGTGGLVGVAAGLGLGMAPALRLVRS
jgi:hypothetical protein